MPSTPSVPLVPFVTRSLFFTTCQPPWCTDTTRAHVWQASSDLRMLLLAAADLLHVHACSCSCLIYLLSPLCMPCYLMLCLLTSCMHDVPKRIGAPWLRVHVCVIFSSRYCSLVGYPIVLHQDGVGVTVADMVVCEMDWQANIARRHF